jgi:hypothetical protein
MRQAEGEEGGGIPFGGIMFYDERRILLYASGQGSENIIYTVSSDNTGALMNEVNAYNDYWSQKRPCLGCENSYNDPNYFQNLAIKYGSNSYSVIAGYGYDGNPYTLGYINAPWYMYVAAGITIPGEGYVYGRYKVIPYYQNYSVANTWKNYFGLKTFNPWW